MLNSLINSVTELGVDVGGRLLGAIALWIVGRFLIGVVKRFANARMNGRGVDPTLGRYLDSALDIVLNVVLVVAVLGVFGVETTTFAGLLAAAGVAIGMAWSGLLANFAAGAFMIALRPFKVGDLVEVSGQLGIVQEIGLFVTTINTLDNIRTIIGNNAVFSGTIRNFSANPYRRVELVAQLAHGVDHDEAIEALRARITQIPNVRSEPAPDLEILSFNLAGPVLAVRPFCHNDHYWQVYFDTNRAIREAFGEKGFPVPEQHLVITQQSAS
ncbi:MAG: mechanosensitive ion channel family protein [Alphaproteobacteria bacterium]|nr:mechanosensitive ion channel family protein [Alphaproteobacteria bacterium]